MKIFPNYTMMDKIQFHQREKSAISETSEELTFESDDLHTLDFQSKEIPQSSN